MTASRKRTNHSFQPTWEERTRALYLPEEPENRSSAGFFVAVLTLFALAGLCVAGFLAVRFFVPGSSPAILPRFETWTPSPTASDAETQPTPIASTPAPGNAVVGIAPQQGTVNTLITVTGQGWWPGEPVFVFLRSKDEGDSRGYSYAAAVADDQGSMHTALTFPNEMRWIGQEWADVIARGSRSGREAATRFTLLAPTATATLPPPTARPTLAPTRTPLPTYTALPTSTPTPEVVITDWRGEYYANVTVSGDPVLVRNDTSIAFYWGEGSPGPQVPVDRFSARWTRRLRFDEGIYQFLAKADDGVRLWIDGLLVIDQWHDGPLTPYSVNVELGEGRHALQLEYYENLGGAAVEFGWSLVPQATATPTPEPVITDWRGEYYANATLAGDPVLVRNDTSIDFNWGRNPPASQVPADGFSARWTRSLQFATASYRFVAAADDGVRLWIDGQLVIDEWHDGPLTPYSAEFELGEGMHALQLEYYENLGDAAVKFTWSVIELPTATPTATPIPEPAITEWRGEYYSNATLAGDPALVRNDTSIAFNWGDNSPAPEVPADHFSARWTRSLQFSAGTYRFVAAADDGVRLWIDGQLVVDQWRDGPLTSYAVDVELAEGGHALQLEYYENVSVAGVELTWSVIETPTAEPTNALSALPSVRQTWHAEYFSDADFSGSPVLVRKDTDVSFSWGSGSPSADIPADEFAVRWTQQDRVL